MIFNALLVSCCFLCLAILWFYAKLQKNESYKRQCDVFTKENEALKQSLNDATIAQTQAITKHEASLELITKLEQKIVTLETDKHTLHEALHATEKREQTSLQRLEDLQAEMQNWEEVKKRYLEMTQATVLKTSSEISSKLLDDHKREAERTKQESEKQVKETTEKLHGQFEKVFNSMEVLSEKVKRVETVERALLSPSGAGVMAETSLANLFKDSSLHEGNDYVMQYNIAGEGLRPDAVVFLPSMVMVIDSKASKFFLEIEQADTDEEKQAIRKQLKKTFHDHLKALVSRDYRDAIHRQVNLSSHHTDTYQIVVYMYLPSEEAVGKLREIDPQFEQKAWKEGIFPVGPTGLKNALLLAEVGIARFWQQKNSEAIMHEVKALIQSVAKLHGHAESIGKRAKGTVDAYDKFAASFNRTFLSKVKKVDKMGAGSGQTLQQLERYKVESPQTLIDVEIEENTEEEKSLMLETA